MVVTDFIMGLREFPPGEDGSTPFIASVLTSVNDALAKLLYVQVTP